MQTRAAQIAEALSTWFELAARDLPWRRTRDPYAIWVSEVMLQQTRVSTVERYYGDFLGRFPSVEALASAAEDDVLAAWSGLGYYRRARMLHAGARYVVDQCGGAVPQGETELRRVPGIGPYTAGAIASIAHNAPVPLVDGNISRVLSRIEAIEDPKAQGATDKGHVERVAGILRAGRPRVLAQALMELGATVCTPKSPDCPDCPLQDLCRATARGLQSEIPQPKQRKAVVEVDLWALRVQWGQHVLLERRPDDGLLAGMWTMPLCPRQQGSKVSLAQWCKRLGFACTAVEPWPPEGLPVTHVFTHRKWNLRVLGLKVARRPSLRGDVEVSRRWWRVPSFAAADTGIDNERVPHAVAADGGIPMLTRKLLRARPS